MGLYGDIVYPLQASLGEESDVTRKKVDASQKRKTLPRVDESGDVSLACDESIQRMLQDHGKCSEFEPIICLLLVRCT